MLITGFVKDLNVETGLNLRVCKGSGITLTFSYSRRSFFLCNIYLIDISLNNR